jgi:DNA-binding HxlR family transcriptional regulator
VSDRAVNSVLRQLEAGDRFGLELLAGSGGSLLRASLYTQLARMEGEGLIEGRVTRPYGRRKYRITELGRAIQRAGLLPVTRLPGD